MRPPPPGHDREIAGVRDDAEQGAGDELIRARAFMALIVRQKWI
jgi:hypothetical protein